MHRGPVGKIEANALRSRLKLIARELRQCSSTLHREVKWVVGGVGVGCGSEGALQGLQGGELYWGLTTLGSTG
uniref:HDC08890 n=1 Tax=Drosophila melanogaster TaxID=7227 RepID=Q6ILN0_DROME|nr:TPA_inf: HDC08890 [Drosophila melanogaster]